MDLGISLLVRLTIQQTVYFRHDFYVIGVPISVTATIGGDDTLTFYMNGINTNCLAPNYGAQALVSCNLLPHLVAWKVNNATFKVVNYA